MPGRRAGWLAANAPGRTDKIFCRCFGAPPAGFSLNHLANVPRFSPAQREEQLKNARSRARPVGDHRRPDGG